MSRGDRVLDIGLFAFAGWTLVYAVSVVVGLGSTVALLLWAPVAVLAAGWAARLGSADGIEEDVQGGLRVPWVANVQLIGIVLALLTAALFAWAVKDVPWGLVWVFWVAAAFCGLAAALARRPNRSVSPTRQIATLKRHGLPLESVVTALWSAGLAVLALLTLNPDDDDTYYVRLPSWIGTHGVFPTRDIVFGDQVLPALYYPPTGSYEPLLGAFSHLTGITGPAVVYYLAPPVGAVLAVLALRRMLRSWRVALPAVALSVALCFLLADSIANQAFGSFFIGRMWQGKTLLLCVIVPLLFALFVEFGARPSRAGAARLAAAGVCAVGLSTTGVFLVPVVAAGCAAALAIRSRRDALIALAAACAYPVLAGLVTTALGGRVPDIYTDDDVVAGVLIHLTLFRYGLAFVAVVAILVAPALIPRALAARMVAAVVALVALLYTPGVPLAIFHLSDLGRVLWRLNWAVPLAGLVGALAVGIVRARAPLALRLAPAAALIAIFVVVGRTPWDSQSARGLVWPPAYKRFPEEVAAARTALQAAGPGDIVYAERKLSQTLGILSPRVTTVNPRGFFTTAVEDEPAALAPERKRLHYATYSGLEPSPALVTDAERLGVDVVCMPPLLDPILQVFREAGWIEASSGPEVSCLKPG